MAAVNAASGARRLRHAARRQRGWDELGRRRGPCIVCRALIDSAKLLGDPQVLNSHERKGRTLQLVGTAVRAPAHCLAHPSSH